VEDHASDLQPCWNINPTKTEDADPERIFQQKQPPLRFDQVKKRLSQMTTQLSSTSASATDQGNLTQLITAAAAAINDATTLMLMSLQPDLYNGVDDNKTEKVNRRNQPRAKKESKDGQKKENILPPPTSPMGPESGRKYSKTLFALPLPQPQPTLLRQHQRQHPPPPPPHPNELMRTPSGRECGLRKKPGQGKG
jgi:hypothetical protein